MFTISYGSEKRENDLASWANRDHTTAVILAAVHFEWMIKRTILTLGTSPTGNLRKELENIYKIKDNSGRNDYISIWKREVANHIKHSGLGTVLGNLPVLQTHASTVRGKVVHGNGTVAKKDGQAAVEEFLKASKKLRDFASKHGVNIDARLKSRRQPKSEK
jgi:hypothetical protein